MKKINRTINRNLLKKGGLFLGGLAVFICVIIDLAINRDLSWSLIVIASLVSLMIISATAMFSQTHKGIKSLLCFSLLAFPYLFVLEHSLLYANYTNHVWFKAIAAPIALLWLAILWVTILCQLFFKWHWAYSAAFICFISVFANQLTNFMLGAHQGWLNTFITSGLGSLLGGFLCLWLGSFLSKKNIS